jgi:uncharacterized protein YecE (DUF72 family)
VNTSFYHIPAPKLTQGWVQKTAHLPEFGFWIKLYQGFTHERQIKPVQVRQFRDSLQLLRAAGKLHGLLGQFPYSFRFSEENLGFLAELSGQFADLPQAWEFRHRSWDQDAVYNFFRQQRLIWTNIDQPVISQSLPLTAQVTNPQTAYFRLHGRNYRSWFADDGRDARYDYCYGQAELQQIGQAIQKIRSLVKKIFVSGNNHYKGNAVGNLLELKKIIAAQEQ